VKKETIAEAVKELEERFEENPLQYTVESALVSELIQILRDKIEEEKLTAEGKYQGNGDDFDFTNYKEPYLKQMSKEQEINRILPEVNIGDRTENKRLDIAVLRPGEVEIEIKKGSKYFSQEDVQHAIEFKYVKNDNIVASRNKKRSEPDDEIFPHTSGDIPKLRRNAEDSETRWMIIASNKDIFKQEEPEEEAEDAHERYRNMKEECEERQPRIELREFHLQKKEE
jgi:hypothetical protein